MPVSLKTISTRAPKEWDKKSIRRETKNLNKRLRELQNLLFAESKHSLLIVFQGMDASGKDGAVKNVFKGVNPMGCLVKSWKKPTKEEFSHDFLWRIHKATPAKGMISIFNRSHYEEVLIQRVHHWIDEKRIMKRFDFINTFENMLEINNTKVLKFYLHISKQRQLERLDERKINPLKMWKYNKADYEERKYWDDYMHAYESVFEHCSPDIPWNIVPADQNWVKEYVISKKLVDTLEGFMMKYPELSDEK